MALPAFFHSFVNLFAENAPEYIHMEQGRPFYSRAKLMKAYDLSSREATKLACALRHWLWSVDASLIEDKKKSKLKMCANTWFGSRQTRKRWTCRLSICPLCRSRVVDKLTRALVQVPERAVMVVKEADALDKSPFTRPRIRRAKLILSVRNCMLLPDDHAWKCVGVYVFLPDENHKVKRTPVCADYVQDVLSFKRNLLDGVNPLVYAELMRNVKPLFFGSPDTGK